MGNKSHLFAFSSTLIFSEVSGLNKIVGWGMNPYLISAWNLVQPSIWQELRALQVNFLTSSTDIPHLKKERVYYFWQQIKSEYILYQNLSTFVPLAYVVFDALIDVCGVTLRWKCLCDREMDKNENYKITVKCTSKMH